MVTKGRFHLCHCPGMEERQRALRPPSPFPMGVIQNGISFPALRVVFGRRHLSGWRAGKLKPEGRGRSPVVGQTGRTAKAHNDIQTDCHPFYIHAATPPWFSASLCYLILHFYTKARALQRSAVSETGRGECKGQSPALGRTFTTELQVLF